MAEQNTLQFPADVSKGEEPSENMDPVPEGAASSLSTSENDKKTSEQAGDESDESDRDKHEENKKTSNLKKAEIKDRDQSAADGEIQTTQPGGSSQSSHSSSEKTETNDSTNQQQTEEKGNLSNTPLNGSDDSGQNREPDMDPETGDEADNSSEATERVSKQAEIKDGDQSAAAGEIQTTQPGGSSQSSHSSSEKTETNDSSNQQQTEAGETQATLPEVSFSQSSLEKAVDDNTDQQQTEEKGNPSNTPPCGADDSGQNREPDMDPETGGEADNSSGATEGVSKQAEIKDGDQSAAAGETQATQPEVSFSQSSLEKAVDDNTDQQQTEEKGNPSNMPPCGAAGEIQTTQPGGSSQSSHSSSEKTATSDSTNQQQTGEKENLSNTPLNGSGDSGRHIELAHPSLRSRSKNTSTETKSKADSAADDENERAEQQNPVTKMENIKEPGHHTYLIMAGVVILAFSLLWWIVIQQEPSSQQDDKRHIDIFLGQLEKLKNQFSNQRPELWSRSKIHLKRHLELAQPTEPVSLILTAGVKAGRTLHCLAQGLATAFSSARNGSVLHISGASRANQDSDVVKLDIDSQLREAFEGDKHVAVIHRFEELPPGSTLIFYRYCDHENAAYKKTFLLFTVLLGEEEEIPTKRSLSAVEEMVDDHLRKKFLSGDHPVSFDRMDIDKYGGLWSRISHLILPVMSEEKMEQVGC